MKIVITGGTGHVGQDLIPRLLSNGHTVSVISRSGGAPSSFRLPDAVKMVTWDGRTVEAWASEIDGADVVLNMAGRSVNCRYTEENLRQMMDSRVDSTRVIGEAIGASKNPPKVWLQMSTATIYAHRFDAANDEATGLIGGSEPGVPAYWKRSIDIAQAWETELERAETPQTRKVALRTAMVMSRVKGSVFDVLSNLVRFRLGGKIGTGTQYVSWIHAADFHAAIMFLIGAGEIRGEVNVAAPGPLSQADFMADFRRAMRVRVGLPATAWMCEIGAFVLRTDTELLLKSRRVVPGRLLEHGFKFQFPDWSSAVRDLAGTR